MLVIHCRASLASGARVELDIEIEEECWNVLLEGHKKLFALNQLESKGLLAVDYTVEQKES